MDPRFSKLIADYQARVAEAVTVLEAAGYPRPSSDSSWAGADGPPPGEIASGYRFFKHGAGCAVHGPGWKVDFDFGEQGQLDGFTLSRLESFAAGQLGAYGLESASEIDALFERARDDGELLFSGYLLYYLSPIAEGSGSVSATRQPMKDRRPPLDPEGVPRFADVAARFCRTMETEPASIAENVRELRLLAAELHLAALNLPDLQPQETAPHPVVDRSRLSRRRLAALPNDFYWDIFEPLILAPDEPVCNSIADDLNDIYGDVKLGLMLHEQGHVAQACWQWRFLFQIHWGEHLVGLMRALYWIVRENESIVDSETD